MNYKVCAIEDAESLCCYIKKTILNEHEMNILQLYSNDVAVGTRIGNVMEVAIMAKENDITIGVITAVNSGPQGYWTIIFLHVDENYRRKKIASTMISKLENQLKEQHENVKLSTSLLNEDRSILACYIINGFDPEGKISTLIRGKQNIVLGKKIIKEV